MAAIQAAPAVAELDSLLCGSSFTSNDSTETSSSNFASPSSTPPTTVSPDSMSLASEPDLPKPESGIAPSIEAVIAVTDSHEPRAEQHASGQQTPVGEDAIVVAEPPRPTESSELAEPSPTSRPRRARSSLPVYNLAKLAGTDIHGKRRSKGDAVVDKRRRTISEGTLANHDDSAPNGSTDALERPNQAGQDNADASRTRGSAPVLHKPKSARVSKKSSSSPVPARLTRRAARLSGAPVENLTLKLSALGKRGKKAIEKGFGRLSRELLRLKDTDEFAHIDTRPVRYTVWSNGKYVDIDPSQETPAREPPRKKVKVDEKANNDEQKAAPSEKPEAGAPDPAKKPRQKKWLEKGLYAGQEAPTDIFKGLTAQEKKKLASLPELMRRGKPNKTFPLPMYNGLRILIHGRDFKLPFDVCNPLPPGQPKPAAYRTMTKNRFVGDAASYWKKTPHIEDFASKCVCKPEDGCGEDCQNRIMLYECDETNCGIGKEYCQNRAFQDLQERTKKGGRYRIGVEVFKTKDRGYGVRSNRCFEPNQIIMEYTGEIITVAECERRMNEEYKDNECYYLMSFDQNMIIDATTGSIARFVNHSCSPNCRMIKWIVAGQPRMALFAGDRPIMTGEELTYDYNFDPFSAKNVQKCLCGSPNCRGVLGPKPKEVKTPKPAKEEKKSVKTTRTTKTTKTSKASAKEKATVRTTVKVSTKTATKRKVKDAFEFDGDEEEEAAKTVKKRKIKTSTGVKRTVSSAGLKAAKGAAKKAAKGVTTIKRSVSTISVSSKKKTGPSSSSKVVTTKAAKVTKKKTTTAVQRGVSKKIAGKKSTSTTTSTATSAKSTTTAKPKTVVPSRSPSLTIVAAGVTTPAAQKKKNSKGSSTPVSATPATSSSASAKGELPKLTISGSGKTSARKWTPSRKALEAGVVLAGSPASARSPAKAAGSPKIKLVSSGAK
ncbi:hypothetical protein MYCTH_2298281 [Thermothelomyces thermophilus ATCC 42464]|uniref:SET domain-containing protein n=1 Tax=Thermothelomyces thermophilus (strain ATCC 42464 / BCRC 31852 / DSM 1799) TaxID=573729 RepID=G2Q1J8_THET4|nr:uncharacterized protein MYCTH_2298281 [Thermothelomyces thermophilus ATCC 42464]AEO54989.1 hypothetical protein MYCTH_2298281 [Thermothelomyces thermophilus ATCC 42464]